MLGLPSLADALAEAAEAAGATENPEISDVSEENEAISDMLIDAEKNLDMIDGTDHQEAMDVVYKETLQHARDLMDMGFNVDLPRARGIFEQASAMYGRAMEAKNSKRDAELKLMRLMLDKRKLDIAEQKLLNGPSGENIPDGIVDTEGVVVEDRNTLIEMIRNSMKEKK